MSLEQATKHIPEKSTYAIRIFNSEIPSHRIPKLRPSEYYRAVREYIFDDASPDEIGRKVLDILFDRVIAEQMIRDFAEYGRGCDALLIHCLAGKNRSPSVGIAFNEIFSLGHDSKNLEEKFPNYRRHIKDTLVEVASTVKIK